MEAKAARLLRQFPSSFWEGCGAKNKIKCKNNVSLCRFSVCYLLLWWLLDRPKNSFVLCTCRTRSTATKDSLCVEGKDDGLRRRCFFEGFKAFVQELLENL